MRQAQKPLFSPRISEFCDMLRGVQKEYDWSYNEVGRLDLLTQDYLHKLELDGLDYKERAKIATQLARCRQQRRACKDTTYVLRPLVEFLNSERGKNLYNLLCEVLGKTRKVEENLKTRSYVPRVLTDEEKELSGSET